MTKKRGQKRGGSPTVSEGSSATEEIGESGDARASRKGAQTQSVRSPRITKGNLTAHESVNHFSPTLGDIDLHLFGEGKH